jgi:AcrR family transcriptional regulator
VVEKANVAKTTLYRHFPSKDHLVIAFLAERERVWTVELLERQSAERGSDAEGQLLAIFDVLDEWFERQGDYEACSFVKVLFEMGSDGPVGQACVKHLDHIRQIVAGRAQQAGLRDPMEFAHSWNILMKGAIVTAAEGDTVAARRAKRIAAWLIEQHRA